MWRVVGNTQRSSVVLNKIKIHGPLVVIQRKMRDLEFFTFLGDLQFGKVQLDINATFIVPLSIL